MQRDAYQLVSGAAAIYERQKVNAIFRPLAEATLAGLSVSRSDSVLDVACGTGIVARVIRERIDPVLPVTGVDLNPGMIETAIDLTRDAADAYQWHVADISGMPFPDGVFTLAICQQGLQFFPDEMIALREIRRVLRFGGQVVLTVWAGPSRFFIALAEAIARHVSQEGATRSLAPFAYKKLDAIPKLLASAGFDDVCVSEVTIDRRIVSPTDAIPREIMGNPVGPEVEACGSEAMSAIISDVMADCADLMQGSVLVAPQTARMFSATAI